MKKLLIILLSALSLTAVAQQKKVAVYVTGEQSGISKVLGDQLVAAFAKSGKYTAVERTSSFLAELGKEQNYQRTGAVSDNEIARLGIQFGVNYVCVADISDVFGEKYITARLINVETSEIVNTHNVSGEMNNMNSCLRMAGEIAENLSKGTFAEQAAEAATKEEKAKLQKKEYVDLGLPSGTLWKAEDEDCGFINFDRACKFYGEFMPSKEQLNELVNSCLWIKEENGFRVTGKNGNSIFFPFTGFEDAQGKLWFRNGVATIWSSTRYDSEHGWMLNIHWKSGAWVGNDYFAIGLHVRLVK